MTSDTLNPAAASPGKEFRSLIHPLETILERLKLERMFPVAQPLEVELGSGDGSFLVEYSRQHPERNFVGVERLLGRMQKLDRKGRRAGLHNLAGVRIETTYFLDYLLPRHSAQALHIYFPDPWPKRKHRDRRLLGERFPKMARLALVQGGRVYLRTDDKDYFEQMMEVFGAAVGWRPVETPAELAGLPTDFEREFHSRGIQTLRAAYEVGEG